MMGLDTGASDLLQFASTRPSGAVTPGPQRRDSGITKST
jgi:hypothetical protein